MAFTVTTSHAAAGGVAGDILTLADAVSGAAIEVWPAFGFNCLRWRVDAGPVFYTAPDWATNPVATRSGHPILFPFPNRMRHGHFTFAGKSYHLPLNESSGRHAIHGFTPKTPWRVVGATAGEDSAEVTGEFRIREDRPDVAASWPGDMSIRVSYRLSALALDVTCLVRNHGNEAAPFGLGYHPYFVLPSLPDRAVDGFVVRAPAGRLWLTAEGVATGETIPTPPAFDFGRPRPVGDAALDHLYGDRPPDTRIMATITHPGAAESVTVSADAAFREVLLFTPPPRTALAVEPYTCTGDALNLAARGVDAGLRVLGPGEKFAAVVRYEVTRN